MEKYHTFFLVVCVAVGSCCCKTAVFLCNVRDFHFCLIKQLYAAPGSKSISVVAIVVERDITSIRHREYWQCLCATPIKAGGGFYGWVESSALPLVFNFLQVNVRHL